MPINVCPAAIVAAPVEKIWALLSDPSHYSAWWDAQTETISPPGPAQPGQLILAYSRALGIRWRVQLIVEVVDASRHTIRLDTHLPLGIRVFNQISIAPIDPSRSRVQFG